MDIIFLQEAQKAWDRLSKNGAFKEDLFELASHKKMLNVFHVGPFYYYIFDLINLQFRFMSPEIKEVLGYPSEIVDVGFFLSKIHPDDQPIFLNHENTVTDFFNKLPLDKITKYKVNYDYRVLNQQGNYVRILQQVAVLQYDDDKRILSTLGVHTDITHIKTENDSKLSFIGLDGEPSYYDVQVKELYVPSKELFSKREKEVVLLLLKGMKSTEIAAKLYISNYTVGTHRKNILAKTGTKNTPELINKIIREGLV